VKFGRKPKLSPYQRAEAIKRRAAGETLTSIARSYGVAISMISRMANECAVASPLAPRRENASAGALSQRGRFRRAG
jgi:hypothetical protein